MDIQKEMMRRMSTPHPAMVPGMGYVMSQPWQVYDTELGYERGTIFPALDLPFIGEEAIPRG